jgi:hypothetical protein
MPARFRRMSRIGSTASPDRPSRTCMVAFGISDPMYSASSTLSWVPVISAAGACFGLPILRDVASVVCRSPQRGMPHRSLELLRPVAPRIVRCPRRAGRRVVPSEPGDSIRMRGREQGVHLAALRPTREDRPRRAHRVEDGQEIRRLGLQVRRRDVPAGHAGGPAVVQDQPSELRGPGEERAPVGLLPHQIDVALIGIESHGDVDRPLPDGLVGDEDAIRGLHVVRVRCAGHAITSRSAARRG